MDAMAPLLLAVSGLPALGIAAWYANDGAGPHARRTALLWALIALAILLGAIGLYFAGGSRGTGTAVVVAMVVVVNALVVALVLHLRRGGGQDR